MTAAPVLQWNFAQGAGQPGVNLDRLAQAQSSRGSLPQSGTSRRRGWLTLRDAGGFPGEARRRLRRGQRGRMVRTKGPSTGARKRPTTSRTRRERWDMAASLTVAGAGSSRRPGHIHHFRSDLPAGGHELQMRNHHPVARLQSFDHLQSLVPRSQDDRSALDNVFSLAVPERFAF